ncbi:MAG TPA: hypothetical protein VFN74_09530 [Chloroflexota bacterium]|nr:hypothetical protein [Chloroflexota bacterium]
MASTYAPPTRRFSARAAALPATNPTQVILLLVATAVFFVSALAILLPQTPIFVRQLTAPSAAPVAPAQLSPDQLEHVLSYARAMQPDDELVQVRPGVFAKRSNVHGVTIDGRTYFYDVAAHQSFGPLRAGTLTESQVTVLAREAQPNFLILVYTRK